MPQAWLHRVMILVISGQSISTAAAINCNCCLVVGSQEPD